MDLKTIGDRVFDIALSPLVTLNGAESMGSFGESQSFFKAEFEGLGCYEATRAAAALD